MCKENTPKAVTIIELKFYDLNLVERLHVMADELDMSWDELVNMAVHRLLDDIYIIRMLWSNKKVYLKESNIFKQGFYGVLGYEEYDFRKK